MTKKKNTISKQLSDNTKEMLTKHPSKGAPAGQNPVKKVKNKKGINWHWMTKGDQLAYWNGGTVPDSALDQIADELIEWASKPGAFKLAEFTTERGILYKTFLDWCAKNPKMNAAHEFAKEKIGVYREQLATFKEHNCHPGTLNYVMGHYCATWRKEQDLEVERRTKEENKQASDFHVFMKSFDEEEEE